MSRLTLPIIGGRPISNVLECPLLSVFSSLVRVSGPRGVYWPSNKHEDRSSDGPKDDLEKQRRHNTSNNNVPVTPFSLLLPFGLQHWHPKRTTAMKTSKTSALNILILRAASHWVVNLPSPPPVARELRKEGGRVDKSSRGVTQAAGVANASVM